LHQPARQQLEEEPPKGDHLTASPVVYSKEKKN